MNKAKEDLLLHPVRMRIMQTVGLREVTPQLLARELPDIPQATLYRNINTLAAAGILSVVRERRVHNAREKTYALARGASFLNAEDLKDARPEDYLRLFTRYLGQLLGYYTRYVERGDVDFVRDVVGFQMLPVHLSESEAGELARALGAALLPFMQNEPSPERRRFILGLMSLPDVAGAPSPERSATGKPAAGTIPAGQDHETKESDHE